MAVAVSQYCANSQNGSEHKMHQYVETYQLNPIENGMFKPFNQLI